VPDRHGQNRPTRRIRDFNFLPQTASRSAQGSLTQNASGALNSFDSNSGQIRKFLTFSITWQEVIAISHVKKIARHGSSPREAIIEENA
jgi:hypothetical protein